MEEFSIIEKINKFKKIIENIDWDDEQKQLMYGDGNPNDLTDIPEKYECLFTKHYPRFYIEFIIDPSIIDESSIIDDSSIIDPVAIGQIKTVEGINDHGYVEMGFAIDMYRVAQFFNFIVYSNGLISEVSEDSIYMKLFENNNLFWNVNYEYGILQSKIIPLNNYLNYDPNTVINRLQKAFNINTSEIDVIKLMKMYNTMWFDETFPYRSFVIM
jgi:hypothetical protein